MESGTPQWVLLGLCFLGAGLTAIFFPKPWIQPTTTAGMFVGGVVLLLAGIADQTQVVGLAFIVLGGTTIPTARYLGMEGGYAAEHANVLAVVCLVSIVLGIGYLLGMGNNSRNHTY